MSASDPPKVSSPCIGMPVAFRLRARTRLVCLISVAILACTPSTALAVNFWNNCVDPETEQAGFTNLVSIRSVNAFAESANYKAGAGLLRYAGVTYGWNYACHQYAAAHNDSPVIANPHSVFQCPMQGYYYNSNVC